MLLAEIVETSRRVGATRARGAKIEALAACLRGLPPAEVEIGAALLAGELRQGRIGVGPATIRALAPASAAAEAGLGLPELDAALEGIAALAGPGSAAERRRRLEALLARATPPEQDLLRRVLVGEIRQGALEGVLVEAIARAARVSPGSVRRALMLSGSAGRVARSALQEGEAGLAGYRLELFRPLQPMLARSAADPEEALERLGRAALEWKLDGARVQVHRVGEEVRVFTRRLNDVTAAVPEVVEAVRALPARSLVLDGEALALDAGGGPRPFQETMRRFGRRKDVAALREALPLRCFFFDCLHRDGQDWIDRPGEERFGALAAVAPAAVRVPRREVSDAREARDFLDAALAAGHEGAMAKAPDAPYEAGRRGAGWLKLKPAHTLDLVVLAAEWGSGRRRGWLSNLHLGARDPAHGGFAMLGKTFKGLTDAMLDWQTRRLLELEIGREGHVVHVRPEQVVEIACDGVQRSPQYPAGLALRFARVRRYRDDKPASEADGLERVRALGGAALGAGPVGEPS